MGPPGWETDARAVLLPSTVWQRMLEAFANSLTTAVRGLHIVFSSTQNTACLSCHSWACLGDDGVFACVCVVIMSVFAQTSVFESERLSYERGNNSNVIENYKDQWQQLCPLQKMFIFCILSFVRFWLVEMKYSIFVLNIVTVVCYVKEMTQDYL